VSDAFLGDFRWHERTVERNGDGIDSFPIFDRPSKEIRDSVKHNGPLLIDRHGDEVGSVVEGRDWIGLGWVGLGEQVFVDRVEWQARW
jgi:hypothetical protein